MNPFETLSDDPILHIFSYLPRNDLLKLTLMDRNFNRVITKSRETMSKIPLVLDFEDPIAIDDVMELAHKRQFRVLKLQNINETIEEKFSPLLEHLSGTVEHLEMSRSEIGENQFRKILELFLPMLKTCDVVDVIVFNTTAIISEEAISDHPLKSLRVYDSDMVKFFSGCKQLKSFEFLYKDDTDCVYEFLAEQSKLEKLKFSSSDVDLSRMVFIQLKELSLVDGESGAPNYLLQLPNLAKLHIKICDGSYLNRTMTTICNASKLEHLYIDISCHSSDFALELKRLENHTVKTLRILDGEATGWLLHIFRGVELVSIDLQEQNVGQYANKPSFEIKYYATFSDPSEFPHEMIDKIEFQPVNQPFDIMFNPHLVPANVQSFEAAVMKFAEKFCARIDGITIGDSDWLDNGYFKLSNSFCEGVVMALPNLVQLELWSIADRRDFHSFLYRNRRTLKNLKEFKIHRNVDEVRTKKLLKQFAIYNQVINFFLSKPTISSKIASKNVAIIPKYV